MFILYPRATVKDIGLVTILTAVCVGGSYALIGFPNINIMEIIIFVTGLIFGIPIGVAVGILSWTIYGVFNPFGFSLPIWIVTMIAASLFGIVGGLVGRFNLTHEKPARFNLEMGLWGLVLTIIYDLITNLAWALVGNVPFIATIVSGWLLPPWFGILHETSNFLLFFTAVLPLTKAIQQVRGR